MIQFKVCSRFNDSRFVLNLQGTFLCSSEYSFELGVNNKKYQIVLSDFSAGVFIRIKSRYNDLFVFFPREHLLFC